MYFLLQITRPRLQNNFIEGTQAPRPPFSLLCRVPVPWKHIKISNTNRNSVCFMYTYAAKISLEAYWWQDIVAFKLFCAPWELLRQTKCSGSKKISVLEIEIKLNLLPCTYCWAKLLVTERKFFCRWLTRLFWKICSRPPISACSRPLHLHQTILLYLGLSLLIFTFAPLPEIMTKWRPVQRSLKGWLNLKFMRVLTVAPLRFPCVHQSSWRNYKGLSLYLLNYADFFVWMSNYQAVHNY